MGCIRTSENTMVEIDKAINKYGLLESITILNNKSRQDNISISQPYLNQGRTSFSIYTIKQIQTIDNTQFFKPILIRP
jgi:hypothetical protein